MTLKRVNKVVTYITCADRLLVFRHRDFPEVGVQVPAGTVEEGEDLAAAALREAAEETGLRDLCIVKYLGSAEYDISELRPEMHIRHFFHLEAVPPVPEKWLHFERHPSGGDLREIALDCYWVDKGGVDLYLGFGALLDQLHK